ncbi:hypothetical protein Moror_10665 [Moniliophthora roreri MCA 2997]|uniref:Uncharacterized protein n=1 Tax=Moniliophthora roreri (strain MCA 2997) TaxID=1381753 RepID=V2XFW1_MONRO|nr:hypothetical protein Moror_10665 [Moniliophthora roreri MCA 2997]
MPEPPQKKRCLDVPDGFTTKEREKSRIRAPKFESGFETGAGIRPLSKVKAIPMPNPSAFASSSSSSKPSSKASATAKPVTKPLSKGPAKPVYTSKGPPQLLPSHDVTMAVPGAVVPPPSSSKPSSKVGVTTKAAAKPLIGIPPERTKPTSKGPPQFLPLHEPDTINNSKPALKSLPQFQAVPQAPRNKPISASKLLPPASQDQAQPKMKTLAPPILPLPTPINTSDYKPLAPILPVQSKPKSANQTHMKTIATTRVALATDISSDGAAELASILLQQDHEHDLDEGDWEKRRGVQVSPSKGDRIVYAPGVSVKEKWVKGGLAGHASNVLTKINTSYALWNKEASLRSSALKPDLKMRLVKVLLTSDTQPLRTLAICRYSIQHKARVAPFPLESPSQRERRRSEGEEVKYLITLLPVSVEGEDMELWLWKPWSVVPLPTSPSDIFGFSSVFSVDESRLRVKVADHKEVMLEDEVWLCERVRLVQESGAK